MLNLQKKITTKLFYNKWPYKLVVMVGGVYYVGRNGCEQTISHCETRGWGLHNKVDKPNLIEFCKKYEQFEGADTQVRVEHHSMSIFCNDKTLLAQMIVELQQWAYEVWEPESEADLKFLTSTTARKVVCNLLPHEKYQYRVKIKSSMNIDSRANFASWIKNYGDKINTAQHTNKWFKNGASGYGWSPFLYVEDASTLSMIGLYLGNNVNSIEEFVPRSSINSSLKEQICQP